MITPQMNSSKYAALEMPQQPGMMRPTSSKVGNFLSSDNEARPLGNAYGSLYQQNYRGDSLPIIHVDQP